ncbi:DMT family transporter [Accumulibacter sp.]|uniref:DMT family transporter n=1 Tax=Accumulibacter sp. TaxID=2053492 RepID=UPI0025D8C63E|nr:DMT family transporter [Accumulibacter sp.]MCM8612924.1 DMT family transporter [Accumulibacter sp.]MCM8636617.1 DMT family transporter [Accumulibacter sp.]MCM8639411.1 DMT family transporter [Accumulibacter sp.]
MDRRTPPGAAAFALMTLLCATWGFQQVAIKIASEGISPVLQAGLRSTIALLLLLGWARWRRLPLAAADGTLRCGLLAGLLFALEFVFIYLGLSYTTASRMIVVLYTAPCFTVLGLHLFVAGERMRWRQFLGVALAFAGIFLAFAGRDGSRPDAWIGDLLGLLAALGWAATTVLIRATSLATISATKVLFYQLAVSTLLMLPLSPLLGESGIGNLSVPVLLALAYQGVIVAFASYLTWFWLLTRYLTARLSVFSFLTPLFGVAFGVLLLGDRLTPGFVVAATCVITGIVLVNLPGRRQGGAAG